MTRTTATIFGEPDEQCQDSRAAPLVCCMVVLTRGRSLFSQGSPITFCPAAAGPMRRQMLSGTASQTERATAKCLIMLARAPQGMGWMAWEGYRVHNAAQGCHV